MKICAIICEYNPFHNGHLYQLTEAKARSGADAVLCLMSGNFVQRGESAICDKFTRAKHAVLSGADIVCELPTVFATSNAEIFAQGAISILSKIPSVTTLCFGAENADKAAFYQSASALNNEPCDVSATIKKLTSEGMSYVKARALAWGDIIPNDFISAPNNILGLEYTRAILSQNSSIDILPIQRMGSGYHDTALHPILSSASAIRESIGTNKDFSASIPFYIAKDLPEKKENVLDTLEKYALLSKATSEIANVCDCTEGLENALKKAALKRESLAESLTSPRYTSSRIRRIALQNLLQIEEYFIRACLKNPLYLRVLSVKKDCATLLSNLSVASLPLLIRAHDEDKIDSIAKECWRKDLLAEQVYSLLYDIKRSENIFI